MKKKLRIAIITEDTLLPAWQHAFICQLDDSFLLETVLRIEARRPQNAVDTENKEPWFYRLFENLDKKLFKVKPDATQPINCDHLFTDTITCQFCRKEDVEIVKSKELDVIINLTNLALPEPLMGLSKYGIWYFIHADISKPFSKPIAFWELATKRPEIGAVLCCMRKGNKNPIVLAKTFACTDSLSLSRTKNAILWQSFPKAIKALRNLYLKGPEAFFGAVEQDQPDKVPTMEDLRTKFPGIRMVLKHLFSAGFKKIRQLIQSRFYFNQWALLYKITPEDKPELDMTKYNRIVPPADRFWADPFLYKKNGKYYVFIEELIYKRKLGTLAVMEIDEKGNYTTPTTILSKPYHLSYPFIFEEDGVLFMIPETSANKDIQLYVCTDFPLKWELVKVLMTNVEAVDTTIFKKDGLYWMFTNIRSHNGSSKHSELFLFSSEELASSQWKPHPNNPVVSDIKQSRPAGSLFNFNGSLVRPAQNCSHYYGYGINFCEVSTLNTQEYEQNVLITVDPLWDNDILACHTLNHLDKISVSDALIKRKRYF